MRASHLRLSGFKSFVEPMELPIEDGLSGVVGPNGCGKSNLLDALCWVMGEASFRNMRAKSMEDVIFSGTALRPAHNHAEATLVIDNSDHRAREPWRDADSIEVTRRIERDSGSSYSINGRPALAREARVLFADMIGGAHSPFLVHQGRIAQLISAAPKERRVLLDQAAGIGGLRARRHEAELQLKAAGTNLERLNDALEELQGRLDALKRQERQAKRYRSLAQRIRVTEGLLLHAGWQAARREEETQALHLAQAEKTLENAAREAARASTALQQADEALQGLREQEAASAAGLLRIKNEQERLDARERQLRERKESLETRLAQTGRDLEHEAARLQDFQATRERLATERQGIEAARPEAEDRLRQARQRIAATQERVAQLEGGLEEVLAQLAAARARREEIAREVERQRERGGLLAGRMEEINRLRTGLQGDAALQPDTQAGAPADQTAQERQLEALRQRQEQAEQQLEAARQEESRSREGLEEQEREGRRIEVEIATLKELLGETRNGEAAAFSGVIHELAVEPSYEIALGASMGADLDASLDVDAPVCWRPLPPLQGTPELPAGVHSLRRHIGAPEALARRLSQIGVVDRKQGTALQAQLRPGQSLVSIEGDVWRWDGFHATADAAAGAVAEKLTRRNRLRELEAQLATLQERLPALRQGFAATREAAQAARQAESEARQERRQSETRFFEAREHALRARQESQERAARLKALAESMQRLQEEQAEAELLEARARKELADGGDDAALEQKAGVMRAQVQEAREVLARELTGGQGLEQDIAGQDRRMEEIAVELASWEERIGAIGAQMEALRQRRHDEPEEIARLRQGLLQQTDAAQAKHRAARDALAVGEQRRNECARQEAAAREETAAAREERARRDGLLEGSRQRLGEAAARIQSELGCAPEKVLETIAAEGGAKVATDESPEVLEERLKRLQGERERLGGVNLRAEEDAEETRQRLQTIRGEQEDLLGAIARLRQAIARLNREGRERLSRAFTEVNRHFGELFTRLFGGGAAHLRLLEGEGEEAQEGKDVLEAGLEIMARPPGKRLQSLSLLSGGEQTLTALALIFAVFLANAPPICVLDEADAPLDDINVERFCRLVRDVCESSGSRILLITHHPLTMARMDRLFGVTMQERGVSRLVSVDLEADGGIRERESGTVLALESA